MLLSAWPGSFCSGAYVFCYYDWIAASNCTPTTFACFSVNATAGPSLRLILAQYHASAGTGPIQISVDAGTLQSSSNFTGFTPSPSRRLTLGAGAYTVGQTALIPCANLPIAGFVFGNQMLNQTQLTTWAASVKAARDVVPFPAGTSHLYSVKSGAASLPDAWVPRVGSQQAIKADVYSTLAVETVPDPVWAW
jgi:hypothetical protein